jgi:hypothetical protein
MGLNSSKTIDYVAASFTPACVSFLKEKLTQQFNQVKISRKDLDAAERQMRGDLTEKWDESVRQGTLTEGGSLRTVDLFALTGVGEKLISLLFRAS